MTNIQFSLLLAMLFQMMAYRNDKRYLLVASFLWLAFGIFLSFVQ